MNAEAFRSFSPSSWRREDCFQVMRMKKLLLMIGVAIIIAGVILLAYAALNLFGYYRVMDGSAELYARLHQRATVSFVTGAVLVLLGAVSMIVRTVIR